MAGRGRCSVLPPVINTVAIIPYFVVAAVDMSGYRNTALIIHYIACVIDPPYTVMGALYFISITTTISMLLCGGGGSGGGVGDRRGQPPSY